ncbi:tetratricopeptide repeat protein [bacterium]|nr:tetratricopeptide repeat protein [bacterium]
MKDNIIRKNKKNKIFSLMTCIAFSLLSLLFVLVVQALPLYSTTAIALAGTGPVISFPENSWDFGEIAPDELPTHIFKFKNIGDEVLIIKEAKISCESCIEPLISTKELDPGEEGELKITVNSLDMIGRFTKRIYVESNDPVNPRVVVTVSGFIKEKNKAVVQPEPQPQPQTPFRIGRSYFSQGEYDKAIIEFEKSIELDENHTESYYYLGQCYLQKGIVEYYNNNIFRAYSLYRKTNEIAEKIIPRYKSNIEENPTDLDSYVKLGYIYEVRSNVPFVNEYDEALDYYLQALDVLDLLEASSSLTSSAKDTGTTAYLNTRIGYIYTVKKKYSQAIEYLEVAEKISPRNVEVAYYLGLSYDKIGEKEKAREFLLRVIELAPQSEFAQEAEKILKKLNK